MLNRYLSKRSDTIAAHWSVTHSNQKTKEILYG